MTTDRSRTDPETRVADSQSRRTLLTGAGVAMLGCGFGHGLGDLVVSEAAAQTAAPPGSALVVTLLGTGSPNPLFDRFGPATLVTVGGKQFLFDAGRGVTIRLAQLGIAFGKIDAVFLTHYHSDHTNGLADVWMSGYLPVAFGGRTGPMRLWGPTGMSRIAENLMSAYADDIHIRMADEHVPEIATRIEAHEYHSDGVVFDEDGVKVTAFEVNHGPLIKPAFGYRIDFSDRAVTISGDTKYNENVIKHGTGVDLLIHEVALFPDAMQSTPAIITIMNHHTSPEEAGTVFARAKPKLAAFTHVVMRPGITPDEIAARAHRNYQGPLVVGEDLMRFIVSESVTVQKWDSQRKGYPT